MNLDVKKNSKNRKDKRSYVEAVISHYFADESSDFRDELINFYSNPPPVAEPDVELVAAVEALDESEQKEFERVKKRALDAIARTKPDQDLVDSICSRSKSKTKHKTPTVGIRIFLISQPLFQFY